MMRGDGESLLAPLQEHEGKLKWGIPPHRDRDSFRYCFLPSPTKMFIISLQYCLSWHKGIALGVPPAPSPSG